MNIVSAPFRAGLAPLSRQCRRFAAALVLLPLLSLSVLSLPAAAQEYRNLSNNRFNTVASGPMQALVVDVADPTDTNAVGAALAKRVNAARAARDRSLKRHLDQLKRLGFGRGKGSLAIPDIVVMRQNGRLAVPTINRTRGSDLTFVFPTTGTGSWTPTQAADLQNIVGIVYNELKNVYGNPSRTASIQVLNGDNLPAGQLITNPNDFSGGVYDLSNDRIIFGRSENAQTNVFNLTQMMAIAFHGPASISYDAWERGMARAATILTIARNLGPLQSLYGQGSINIAYDLYSITNLYDLLNQPPLGNDRFFPVSKTNGTANTDTFPLLLQWRLPMSGSAWLKVATDDPKFFNTFNTAYYGLLANNSNLKNSVPLLRELARNTLLTDKGDPTVEGLDFNDWYPQQYILDTSISPGTKLYAFVSASSLPASGQDDFTQAIFLYHYRTTFDANGNSDEVSLGGTCYPIYWDFEYANRLTLGAQYERVPLTSPFTGIGTVAPTFFNTIGGDAALQGRMRITVDLPVDGSNLRLYIAPRSTGTADAPNNFYGTVIGASTGTIRLQADGLDSGAIPVKQGAFGASLDPVFFAAIRRATLTFTPAGGGQPITRRVNTGFNQYVTAFYASDPSQSVQFTFPAGASMISFPIQPYKPKAADALLNPTNDQPLFNDTNLLLAQWKQSLTGDDKYLRYPTLNLLQPGQGYWSNFDQPTTVKIKGRLANQDQAVSTSLINGWNQISNPYYVADPTNDRSADVNVADLTFQYLADNTPISLTTAISRNLIIAQNLPSVGQVVVYEYSPTQGYIPASKLVPWKAYWIRCGVSEGVTITYPNPFAQGRSVKITSSPTRAAVPAKPNGWALPLTIRGTDGRGATAYFGMSDSAATGYDAKMDALRPPDFSRSMPSLAFAHTDWSNNAGDYFSDIRRTGSTQTWELSVYTPDPNQTYTLTWNDASRVPRNMRLLLVDTTSGQKQYLQGASSYSFTPGSATTRKFQIVAEDRTRSTLRIMNLNVRPTRAAGTGSGPIAISFDLSQGATLETEIRGVNGGKVVRRLTSGRAATSGTSSLVWDGRDERGAAVPAGSYLLQVTAHTPEGESVRAIQLITVVR